MPALMSNTLKDVVADGLPAVAAAFGQHSHVSTWFTSVRNLDIMRFITWSLFVIGACVLAFFSNPNEASFRKYLAEESFRKHVQDLYAPPTPSQTKTKRSAGSVEDGSDDNQDGTGESLENIEHATTSDTPALMPFRFSNHVSIHLRTPAYKFRNIVLFSLVAIMPKSSHAHARSHSTSGLGRRASIKTVPPTALKSHLTTGPVSSGVSSEADENGPLHDRESHSLMNLDGARDPTVAGVWFVGAFGRWWSMGAIAINLPWMDSKRTEQLFRWIMSMGEEAGKKKRLLGKSGMGIGKEVIGLAGRRVGGEEAGLMSVVALPKEDVDAEAHIPLPSIRTIITPARAESPPPLRSDATLPLHNREASPQKTKQSVRKSPYLVPTDRSQDDKHSSTIDQDSPLIRELTSSLSTAQASAADLRVQLASFNETIANSQAQLQASVDDLRKKKKDDDADRADLKVKMRGLEENKRQAEGARREAEKKLKAVESIRDAIVGRIEKMKREIAGFRQEVEECHSVIETTTNETDEHNRAVRMEMDERQREMEELEDTMAEDSRLNTELAAQVVEAVDALQALIDNSPQAPAVHGFHREEYEETSRGSNPVTPEVAQFPQHRLPMPVPFANNFRDPYPNAYPYPSSQPQRPSTQATASILRDSAQQYRNPHVTNMPPPAFRDLSGFEGFGPLGAPIRTESEIEDPGSPLGNMSSSFTANLLPQELFRSLEGDQTPSETKLDLDDPWDAVDVENEVEQADTKAGDEKWTLPTPKAASPAYEHAPTISTDPSPEEAQGSPALDAGVLSRAIQDLTDSSRGDGPRRWFSSSKLNALDASSPFSGYVPGKDRHSTLGFPLAQTTSNESLPLPNAGYTNAFAPSAAEKKTLRWSSLGKWGGNINQIRQETPFATKSPFQPPEGPVGRSISAEHNAKYAWEHAVVEKEEAEGGEKKPYRFFSLGRRGKDGESSEQGSSVWKS